MPGEFITVADESGIILPMNRQLLRDACGQLRRWQSLFPSDPPLFMSVNVTAKEAAQTDLASQMGEILRQCGVDPRFLDFEITENIAMGDPERLATLFSELKAIGVRLSIDDFGTGHSSLSRLQRFPVDTLKIDRSFISAMDGDIESHEIVRIIILLAHNLGLKVVAEGVETQEQMEVLRDLGCELGQGYLWSRPVPGDTIEELLASHHSQVGFAKGCP
jgi:EAL domain-containing protein (putative c-di-GMP-specific phosphodiesterase class I)